MSDEQQNEYPYSGTMVQFISIAPNESGEPTLATEYRPVTEAESLYGFNEMPKGTFAYLYYDFNTEAIDREGFPMDDAQTVIIPRTRYYIDAHVFLSEEDAKKALSDSTYIRAELSDTNGENDGIHWFAFPDIPALVHPSEDIEAYIVDTKTGQVRPLTVQSNTASLTPSGSASVQ